MKVSLTEKQILRIKSKLIYESLLNDIVFKLSLITEEGKTEPDMEWDFTEIKKDIDQSRSWVRTKDDALEYVKSAKEKFKSLPKTLKLKMLQYILYGFIGLLSAKEIKQNLEEPIKTAQKVEKKVVKDIEKLKEFRIRKSSEELVDHLKKEETLSLTSYDIGDGAKTIGYGHAIFGGEDEGYKFLPNYNKIIPGKTSITKKQAEILLRDDIKNAEESLNKILDDWENDGIKPQITQGMYDSMISLIFNMGIGNFRKSDFIQKVKRGNFDEAKKEILRLSQNSFKKFPGLKDRREKEAKMFV